MIILLDLNYTLVSNNPARGTTPERMEKRLANEQYRQWLVELVRPHTVVLITARTCEPETAAGGDIEPAEDIQKCRLATAGRPEQHQQLPLMQRQVDVFECMHTHLSHGVNLAQATGAQNHGGFGGICIGLRWNG